MTGPTVIISAIVVLIATGLVQSGGSFKTIKLQGKGFEGLDHTAAFTRISGVGDLFWLFWPGIASNPTNRPLIVWLDGVTGVPPSLRANFEMFGPIGADLERKQDTWINYFNLLLVDAPVGTGYSKAEDENNISDNFDDHVDNLVNVLESFYELHGEHENAPIFVFGQGHGAQLAVALVGRLTETARFKDNIKGVGIGNGIISPALALTKIGFYLEEFGIIDIDGRNALEDFTTKIKELTDNGLYEDAFDLFLTIGKFINENAGAAAINLNEVTQKLYRKDTREHFGKGQLSADQYKLMQETAPPLLGLPDNVKYDEQRDAVTQAFRTSFMKPAVEKVEYLLQKTNVSVTIYNGNLDAISNTPGQLLWVDKLRWSGQWCFLEDKRVPFMRSGGLQGYVRRTYRLNFFLMSSVGQSVPLEGYYGMTRILQIITSS